jgi:uncharacterized protein YkwD
MQYRKAIGGLIATIVVAGTLAALSPPAGAVNDPGAEGDFVARTNALRASKGLGGLSVNGTLAAKARNWAEHMAAVTRISPTGHRRSGTAWARTSAGVPAWTPSTTRSSHHPTTTPISQIRGSRP